MTGQPGSAQTLPSPPIPLSKNRDFLLLLGGQAVSALGTRISLVAFPLFVLALTGSPAKAGLTGFLGTLPYPLLYLPVGALVDRWDRKRVMITADAMRALAFASIPVCQVFHWLSLAQLMIVALIEGTGFVFLGISQLAALPNIVAPSQIASAAAQDQARQFSSSAPPSGELSPRRPKASRPP